jgi:hypothetical protein
LSAPAATPAADLRAVGAAFGLGQLIAAAPHGSGHIHDTYRALLDRAPGGEALLQRINERVFAQPELVMANIERVTAHLRAKVDEVPDAERRALALLPAAAGGYTWRDPRGGLWRAFRFIAGAHAPERAERPDQARQAALAFARFQRDLADLPPPRLHETLREFHHTPRRYADFAASARADPAGRAAGAAPEIDFAHSRESLAARLHPAWLEAALAGRVTHNDTKLNNVLFDDRSGEALCVIDLDTVMPGLPLHDFGDLARFALIGEEDRRDVERIAVSEELFQALAEGWTVGSGPEVSSDLRHLVAAAQVMTYECGLRFLTDHLAGDTYFKIQRPGQNLDRARAHFALVRALESDEERLQRFCEKLAR